jgi:hypothetical protein
MATKGIPMTFLKYSRWDVVSSLHKEIRRGDYERASYWLVVMMRGGSPTAYIAGYFFQIVYEELAPSEVEAMLFAGMLRENLDKVNPYHLLYGLFLLCKGKKWWECPDGRMIREMWAKHALTVDAEKYREIPHYAHDKHTSKGKRLIAEGTADRRWEGTWAGMVYRAEAQKQAEADGMTLDEMSWDAVWNRLGNLNFWENAGAKICVE